MLILFFRNLAHSQATAPIKWGNSYVNLSKKMVAGPVQPGDTLWSIAASRYPSDDVRARVDGIERANGLQSPVIQAGEILKLPA